LGGVSEFLDEKKKATIADFERADRVNDKKKNMSSSQKEFYLQRKEREKLLRKLKSVINRCENKIIELEKEQSAIEDLMADASFYESPGHKQELQKHQVVLNNIWHVEQKWEKAMMELEEIERAH
jgi:uncharacterized pyridoxamine 5'-phosphate oxidase family protein